MEIVGYIATFIVGVLGGFSLCCLICWVKIANRDDEIKLLKAQNKKYKEHENNLKLDVKVLDDDIELDKMMESLEDERTNRQDQDTK